MRDRPAHTAVRQDAEIFGEARRALDARPRVPATVRVHVEQGVVTLTGHVRLPQATHGCWRACRWGLPIAQTGMAGLLVAFWLLFQTDMVWVSVAFYVLGLIFGLLLISQVWTVANLVYDARQAKRLFGFIGGGAPLGGMPGPAFAAIGGAGQTLPRRISSMR